MQLRGKRPAATDRPPCNPHRVWLCTVLAGAEPLLPPDPLC
jgi:hypothetical protein